MKEKNLSSDLKIAREKKPLAIEEVAKKLLVPHDALEHYGAFKAKISWEYLKELFCRPRRGKLVLVTATTPTPAGEGKTTTAIGLTDGLSRLGQKAALCLREPSMGPVFGAKGAATGSGLAQLIPREEINLHFTGDFAAVAAAHNLLAALIDNHLYHGNDLGIDPRKISWGRVVDINDRALRKILVGLESKKSFPRFSFFDIVAASEVMAILCLAQSYKDLRQRIADICIGRGRDDKNIDAEELGAAGAMSVLLVHAFKPNLVQTLENNPAFVHGGPFGNIAHGCSSVVSLNAALRLADWVVTEAGFGSDLGGEKFVNIVCRQSGLKPDCAVIVTTVRALKFHGGMTLDCLNQRDLYSLEKGFPNLLRHIQIVEEVLGIPAVVALNRFSADSEEEIDWLGKRLGSLGYPFAVCNHWAQGGEGAVELARMVLERSRQLNCKLNFTYADGDPLIKKIEKIALNVYKAGSIALHPHAQEEIKVIERQGLDQLPVCMAKTQYSFSVDPRLRGAPEGHELFVRELRVAAGAKYILVLCGEINTMPGLPKIPASSSMDIDEEGKVIGTI
ncbi:formate--tetrahydrofolate ligase [Candidatus Methylacidiphilum infernorum]|uniref:Formate--tetrahydrofolate ligase n=1 Tax=Candidatus Methylacidiphilum infernorum TaxID=511746 RepID=A0ABX7PTY5_9BACT|nr:formate--tetrahydrofolate ligase [Candidatus Methylacidiphilum infernorum]QSR86275.1 formate--tetrahydrofolate ligase [Candidatus Methylacidiphilum infernorum]